MCFALNVWVGDGFFADRAGFHWFAAIASPYASRASWQIMQNLVP
jgi:hypothetical protein